MIAGLSSTLRFGIAASSTSTLLTGDVESREALQRLSDHRLHTCRCCGIRRTSVRSKVSGDLVNGSLPVG